MKIGAFEAITKMFWLEVECQGLSIADSLKDRVDRYSYEFAQVIRIQFGVDFGVGKEWPVEEEMGPEALAIFVDLCNDLCEEGFELGECLSGFEDGGRAQ